MGGGQSTQQSAPWPPPPPPLGDYEPPPKRVFKKGTPPEKVTLSIKDSAGCPSCVIRTDGGMTISSLMMTRDILGKIDGPLPKAPSDNWVWDDAVGFNERGQPYLVENNQELNKRCESSCTYKFANPTMVGQGPADRKVGGNGIQEQKSGDQIRAAFKSDLDAWSANQRSTAAKGRSKRQQVIRMWNPSDEPSDAQGSIALNYETHGALTKLYLKPTLPFNLTFSA
jgi:hypothetical protein